MAARAERAIYDPDARNAIEADAIGLPMSPIKTNPYDVFPGCKPLD